MVFLYYPPAASWGGGRWLLLRPGCRLEHATLRWRTVRSGGGRSVGALAHRQHRRRAADSLDIHLFAPGTYPPSTAPRAPRPDSGARAIAISLRSGLSVRNGPLQCAQALRGRLVDARLKAKGTDRTLGGGRSSLSGPRDQTACRLLVRGVEIQMYFHGSSLRHSSKNDQNALLASLFMGRARRRTYSAVRSWRMSRRPKNSAQPNASLSCLLSRMLGSAPAAMSRRAIPGVAARNGQVQWRGPSRLKRGVP